MHYMHLAHNVTSLLFPERRLVRPNRVATWCAAMDACVITSIFLVPATSRQLNVRIIAPMLIYVNSIL